MSTHRASALAAMAAVMAGLAPGQKAIACDIPLGLSSGGHIALPLRSSGKPLRLLLDPVSGVILDIEHVRRLGVKILSAESAGIAGSARIGGAGAQQQEAQFAKDLRLQIGRHEVSVPLVTIVDLHGPTEGVLGRENAGLLGIDVLREHDVELDFASRCLRLLNSDTDPEDAPIRLPVTRQRERPTIDLELVWGSGERGSGRFLIDFGMDQALRLTTAYVDRQGILHKTQTRTAERPEYGLGGRLESLEAVLPELRVGPYAVRDVPVSLAREKTGADAAPPWDGLIGVGLLRKFRVRFSARRSVLLLWPAAPRSELHYVGEFEDIPLDDRDSAIELTGRQPRTLRLSEYEVRATDAQKWLGGSGGPIVNIEITSRDGERIRWEGAMGYRLDVRERASQWPLLSVWSKTGVGSYVRCERDLPSAECTCADYRANEVSSLVQGRSERFECERMQSGENERSE